MKNLRSSNGEYALVTGLGREMRDRTLLGGSANVRT